MTEQLDSTAIEVRYLLGQLAPSETEGFEARYFEDESAFEELRVAEAELIDAYARDELSSDNRRHLQERLAKSPRLRQRLAFSRTLSRSLSKSKKNLADPEPSTLADRTPGPISWWQALTTASFARRPGMALALAACVLLVVFGGAAVLLQSLRLRNQSQELAAERAAIANERERLNKIAADQREKLQELSATLADAHNQNEKARQLIKELQQKQGINDNAPQPGTSPVPQSSQVFATLLLLPGSRSRGENELVLKPNEVGVKLKLPLDDTGYPNYRVVVRDPNKNIIQSNVLKLGSDRTLVVTLRKSTFAPGYYSVVVSGITPSGTFEPVNDYVFHVPSTK